MGGAIFFLGNLISPRSFMILRSPTENENGVISLHRIGTPFPMMGKGRDKGAPEPIKLITPTFVLPRQGEGI